MTTPITQLLGSASTTLPSFEFNGVSYELNHPDLAAKARLERLIVDFERQTITDMRTEGFITEEEKIEQFKKLAQAIRQGEHTPGGTIFMRYMQTSNEDRLTGLALFHLSLLTVKETGKPNRFATVADITEAKLMFGDASLLPLFAEIVPDFFAWTLGQKAKATPESQASVAVRMKEFYSDVITKLSVIAQRN